MLLPDGFIIRQKPGGLIIRFCETKADMMIAGRWNEVQGNSSSDYSFRALIVQVGVSILSCGDPNPFNPLLVISGLS